MNEIRKAIIELIGSYMDKTLSEGCLVNDTNYNTGISKIVAEYNNNLIVLRLNDLSKPYMERKTDIEDWKILGHYDITAVLKYIEDTGNNYQNWFYKNSIRVCSIDSNDGEIMIDYGELPNKPLHLYTEQEEKDLLELLQNLGTEKTI